MSERGRPTLVTIVRPEHADARGVERRVYRDLTPATPKADVTAILADAHARRIELESANPGVRFAYGITWDRTPDDDDYTGAATVVIAATDGVPSAWLETAP